MNRNSIDSLISYLLAIVNYAKDIHYNCVGENFYSNHLLADRFTNNIYEYIDQLKEVCLIGHQLKPKHSSEYLDNAALLIPQLVDFMQMRDLMIKTLALIETITGVSKGDENLIGAIAQDIQNNVALINIMFGDLKNV